MEISRISGQKAEAVQDTVVREIPVAIFLNDVHLVTMLCSPSDLNYLAVGLLFTEGLLAGKRDLNTVCASEKDRAVWVETKKGNKLHRGPGSKGIVTTGCGKGFSIVGGTVDEHEIKVKSKLTISCDYVPKLMKEFQRRSSVYKLTGGVHSAALCTSEDIIVFNEDIGRHNAIDKVIGECLLKGIRTRDRILVTSGRISSEVLVKAARSGVPIVISKSAPTDISIRLAAALGITLVGFARGSRMNVYSNKWRILTG